MAIKRWDGTQWVVQSGLRSAYVYQPIAPANPVLGDVWVDSDDITATLNQNDYLLKSGGTITNTNAAAIPLSIIGASAQSANLFTVENNALTDLFTINSNGTVISIGAATGTTTVNHNLTVTGDLLINGTTTTLNSTTLSIDDKNIELGTVASPTDVTAAGGGITLKGTTDKTFNWTSAAVGWTSSENISLAAGKDIFLGGSTSGTIALEAIATAGTNTITFPATTGTVYVSSGTDVSLTDGGTNASLTASNGGIVYSTASAMAILSGTATAGQMLRSGATGAPTWSTATFPSTGGTAGTVLRSNATNWVNSTSTFADTYAVNTILYAGTANTVTGLATANSSVLVTSAAGVPSLSTTLPVVTLTTPTVDTINTSLTTTGTAALWNTGITTASIAIGGSLTTGGVSIAGGTTYAGTISLGPSSGTTNKTVSILNGSTAGTQTINVGSNISTSTTNMYGATVFRGISTSEGGQIDLAPANGGNTWYIDSFSSGASATPSLRIINGSTTTFQINSANTIYLTNNIGHTSQSTAAAAATITPVIILTKNVYYTGAAAALTLDTGTNMDLNASFSAMAVGSTVEWVVINEGTGSATLTSGTGHTFRGTAAVAIQTAAKLVTRKSAANTYFTYRMA